MKFIILGCGSSMGVPRPDGFFGNCDPKNKKNYRTRCSAFIKTSNENILFDTSPDLRQQLLRHKIKKIDKVFFSHMHGDQTHGINDLRSFYINHKKQIEVYADKFTSKYLKKSLLKFFVVIVIRSDLDIFFISASFAAVKSIKEGSFFLPLLGTGARKGLSVSIKILSNGNDLNVSCKLTEFLKVIIPLAEK